MIELDRKICEVLKTYPGLKAKDIAAKIGEDKTTINSTLYGRLKYQLRQDSNYRWYLKEEISSSENQKEPTIHNTTLSRICRYYLDCLNHEDVGGVSEFASSRYGDLSYVELPSLPMTDQDFNDIFELQSVQQLLIRIRRDRNKQMLLLGYPVRLKFIRSRTGWEGYKVEPLFLFSFQGIENIHENPSLSNELPQLNFEALSSLSNSKDGIMEEAIQLASELGLNNAVEDQPDTDDLIARLQEIRPDWDWQETIDPTSLSCETPLSNISQQGIYNRAILIAAERSPYTKGLESELGMLQSVDESKYKNTCLGTWLSEYKNEAKGPDETQLLEVLPLNSEQRQAVRQAMSNQLTVITGPPGTGKSQVVTSILINAAWQGKTVLFASKNNQAVDVVETRVNALGSRPVLLRLGNNHYQTRLAEYIASLLAARTTDEDKHQYCEHQNIHTQLQQESEKIDDKFQKLIELRNTVDQLEQHVECIRQVIGESVFHSFRSLDTKGLLEHQKNLHTAIDQADKYYQPFFVRLLWAFISKKRFLKLKQAAKSFEQIGSSIALPAPKEEPNQATIENWIAYSEHLKEHTGYILKIQEYFTRLDDLTTSLSLEELNIRKSNLEKTLSKNSEALWKAWLRLQPSRMTPQQRKLLNDYSALLQMMVNANNQNQLLGRDFYRQYYKLFPQLTSILGCWAVTSLSVRSRVPFEPNFFDLVVIDEASQCDIASALPLLYRSRRAVIIGDPMQLRHISTISEQQDQQLLSKHNLVENYMGWTYSKKSLFDLASSLCQSEDIVFLRDHHRSHADIIEFSNKTFYEGQLRVATNYDRLRRINNTEPAVRWINIKGKSIRPSTGGAVNEIEANTVVDEIKRLQRQNYRGSIGVVSPFRAQANLIKEIAYNDPLLNNWITGADFLADTVHKFQGDERDIMFFSPVVSAGINRGAIGFLKNTPNLFNVAITRARAALIVVGDQHAAINCDISYLSQFASYAESLKHNQEHTLLNCNQDLGPRYPIVTNPEQVSEWEHIFYEALYNAGIRAIPQYSVEKYRLDFAIFDRDRRLNIEIDGERYHRNWDGELCRRDQIRNQRLIELGWDVMRFWVYQVRDSLDYCIDRVKLWKNKMKAQG